MSETKQSTLVTELHGQAGSATRASSSSIRVAVASGPDKGLGCRVGADPVVVGSDPTCDLVLNDRTVSRRHAELRVEAGHLLVTDLGSTNGTHHHRARIREVFVPVGDQVAFGRTEVRVVPDEVPLEAEPFVADRLGPLVGAEPGMRELFGLVRQVADSDATVILEGETGTGKELFAQAIHDASPRAKQPFVVFDCTSQPRDLVESALFGHVKGAYTGAAGPRQGAFFRADGGTLFLDELGELDLELQPKLLRALEAREIQPVGGEGYRRVDVRVIAATHRDLRAEVRAGRFREDLFYRLSVIRLRLPPLRERPGDIPLLVEHFIDTMGAQLTPSMDGLRKLGRHTWPGNVRELRNLVERAAALDRGKPDVDLSRHLHGLDDLEEAPTEADLAHLPFKEAKGKLVSAFEARYIEDLLKTHDHNISVAAREAGVDRKHFKDLMKKYGIEAQKD